MSLVRPLLLAVLLGLSGVACDAGAPKGTTTTEVGGPSTTAVPPADPSCTVDGVVTERDLAYADPAARGGVDPNLVSLDLYRPTLPEGCPPSPIVVYVHGGGFTRGDKGQQVEDKVRLFTGAGWVFASVNYRLAPAVQHPAQVEDLASAVGWLTAHAAEFGADPDRVAVLGHSAGAFLVTLLGTDSSFLEAAGVPFSSLRCVASLDTEGFDVPARIDAGGNQEAQYRNAFGDDPDVWAAASPQRIVEAATPDARFPEFLLVVQGRAERIAGNQAFADALAAIDGSAEVVDANPLDHRGVNLAVGQSGDTIVTPPLMDFLGSCVTTAARGSSAPPRFGTAASLETEGPESTALVDLDRDGDLDLLTASGEEVIVHHSNGDSGFVPGTGVRVTGGRAKGWGLADVTGDGGLDLLPAIAPNGPSGPQQVLIVGPDGLEPATLSFTPALIERTLLVTDFDGDGNDDAFVSGSSFRQTHGWNQLHRGLGDGQFDPVNIIDTAAPAPFWHQTIDAPGTPCDGEEWANTWFKGVVVRDFDSDGRPDLLLNAFADAGFTDQRCPEVQLDLVINQSYRGVFLLRNVSTPGEIRFQDVSRDAFGPAAYGTTPAFDQYYTSVPADLDADGDLDLVSGGVVFGGRRQTDTASARVWRNDSGPGRIAFVDVTAASGAPAELNALPPDEKAKRRLSDGVPLDLENDGDLDLAFTNRDDSSNDDGTRGVVLFRNDGDLSFTEIDGADAGLDQYSNAINAADLDGDGLEDLVVDDRFFTGITYVFNNEAGAPGHWIALDTRGDDGQWPIGARVSVFDTEERLLGMQEVRTDYSYRGKRTPILHFGLGPVTSVDVRVELPYGGGTAWYRDLDADKVHELTT